MTPYSITPRKIIIKELIDRWYFAFDYSNPSGVKLLSQRSANRLHSILQKESELDLSYDIDRALAKSGLCGHFKAKTDSPRFSVWLHLVNACNLSCHYCYIPKIRKVAGQSIIQDKSMQQSTAERTVQNLVEHCQINEIPSVHIKFAGGEPTLNLDAVKHFCDEMEKSKNDISVSYGMISNGVFDFETVFSLLNKYSFSLSISIDGYEGTHDHIRFKLVEKSKQGTWSKIWSNIDRLSANGIDPYILFTVTPKNYHDIHKFSHYVHSRKLGYRLSLVRTKGVHDHNIQRRIADELCELYGNLGRNLDPSLPIARFARFSEWNLSKRKTIACSAGRNYCAIDHTGAASTCQMAISEKQGSLNTFFVDQPHLIKKTSEERLPIVDPTLRRGICTNCEFFHVCAGGCPEHTLLSCGTTDTSSPWCEVYGALVPVYVESIARQMARKLLNQNVN